MGPGRLRHFPTPIPHVNNEATAELGDGTEVPDLGPYRDKPWPKPEKGYAAMVTYLDDQVGSILRHLEKLGLDGNTLVIFTSDNGPELQRYTGYDPAFFNSTGPFRGFKRDHTEGGLPVPFVARWPDKIKPGSQSGHVGYFGDIMATVAELAGVPAPEGLDSLSLVPTLLGRPEEQRRHEVLYWEYHMGNRSTQAVLLDGRWKAVRNQGRQGSLELYDLRADPGETNNLAAAHPDLAAKAESALERERAESQNWPLRDSPARANPAVRK